MSRFLNPTGVGVVHGQDDADGGLPPRPCGLPPGSNWTQKSASPIPSRATWRTPTSPLEALRLDGAEGGLVEIHRPAGVGH
jgi:hypothetical protein